MGAMELRTRKMSAVATDDDWKSIAADLYECLDEHVQALSSLDAETRRSQKSEPYPGSPIAENATAAGMRFMQKFNTD